LSNKQVGRAVFCATITASCIVRYALQVYSVTVTVIEDASNGYTDKL